MLVTSTKLRDNQRSARPVNHENSDLLRGWQRIPCIGYCNIAPLTKNHSLVDPHPHHGMAGPNSCGSGPWVECFTKFLPTERTRLYPNPLDYALLRTS